MQVRLCDISDVQQLMWRIEDSVVQLKRLIADVVVTWNGKIQELVLINKKRDEKHRKNDGGKPSAPPTSNSVECDVVSLKDIYFICFIYFIYLFILFIYLFILYIYVFYIFIFIYFILLILFIYLFFNNVTYTVSV